jgi:hypothetical protein
VLLIGGVDQLGLAQTCVPPPAGLVAWWRGEGDAVDCVGGNNGTRRGNASYGPGESGQGFVFHGHGDGVQFGNAPALRLQTFTIEAWIKRADPEIASHDPHWGGAIFSYGAGGYSFAVADDGHLVLDKLFYNEMPMANRVVTGTNWHHVGVTKFKSVVTYYCDGIAYPAPAPYDPGFSFSTAPLIGIRGGDYLASFLGTIDEVAIYNRALSEEEIHGIYAAGRAGKCLIGTPPSSLLPLANQNGFRDEARTAKGNGPIASSSVSLQSPPFLRIRRSDQSIILSWPFWATNFTLQEAEGDSPDRWAWKNLPSTPASDGNENAVERPMAGGIRFYRLIQP